MPSPWLRWRSTRFRRSRMPVEPPTHHGSADRVQPAPGAMIDRVSLDAAFAAITEPWQPVTLGELNGQLVKAARFRGAFLWHAHAAEDELFLVHSGSFRMEFRDRAVTLLAGEMIIVPRGVDHRPVADGEAEVVLFEPITTVKTGDAVAA